MNQYHKVCKNNENKIKFESKELFKNFQYIVKGRQSEKSFTMPTRKKLGLGRKTRKGKQMATSRALGGHRNFRDGDGSSRFDPPNSARLADRRPAKRGNAFLALSPLESQSQDDLTAIQHVVEPIPRVPEV